MKNAVIYARYSSHGQTEQSIEGQLRVCYEFAKRENIKVVGEYIDRALTGRSDDRPDFQRMISDAKKKAFDYVIVYKLDRFARNRYDSAIYKHKLKQCGVKLLSAMENIGDNPESIILEAVLEASAEYYSVDLSQKIKRGRKESALKGKFIGGGIPTGYKTVGGALVVDEDKAPIIKYAFEEYAKGTPKKEIMGELNARGLRNQAGKPYGCTAFQKALRSEKYIGVLEQCGIRIENGCPALIDKDTFDKVQARLDANARQCAKNKAIVEYLLTGKLFCGHCGSPMQGVSGTGKSGNKWYYYQCAARRKRSGCTKKHEKKDFLEWYVVEQTLEYVLTPPRIQQIAEAVVEQYDKEFGDDSVSKLEKRVAYLTKQIEKLTFDALEMPKASRKPLYDKIEAYDVERADLEIDLSKLKIAHEIRYTEEDIIAWLKSFCRGDLFDMDFRRKIIDVFINSIYLYDDRIIIYYNVRSGKQVSYIEMLESTGEGGAGDDPEGASGVRISNAVFHQSIPNTNPSFIFVNGLFGIVIMRDHEK